MKILYEDKDILVAFKPAGVSAQAVSGFEEDMVSLIKKHLSEKTDVKGEPYVGVVHRLDKMVSGVMVYALTKEAAANLSGQVQKGSITKIYEADLWGVPKAQKGELTDYLIKDEKENVSRVCDARTKGAKEAKLRYKVLEKKYDGKVQTSKVEIELITGRHHQIRVQFASRGTPVMGDHKYGKADDGYDAPQLRAKQLSFTHPRTKKEMKFSL